VPNGFATTTPGGTEASNADAVNGTARDTIPELNETLSPPPTADTIPEVCNPYSSTQMELTCAQPQKDAEGFSVPPSAIDAITEAEREAGL
jgi:hypothetical protein